MSELEKHVEVIANSFKNVIGYWSLCEDINIIEISIKSIEDSRIKFTICFNDNVPPLHFIIDRTYTIINFHRDFKQYLIGKLQENFAKHVAENVKKLFIIGSNKIGIVFLPSQVDAVSSLTSESRINLLLDKEFIKQFKYLFDSINRYSELLNFLEENKK